MGDEVPEGRADGSGWRESSGSRSGGISHERDLDIARISVRRLFACAADVRAAVVTEQDYAVHQRQDLSEADDVLNQRELGLDG